MIDFLFILFLEFLLFLLFSLFRLFILFYPFFYSVFDLPIILNTIFYLLNFLDHPVSHKFTTVHNII